MDVCIEDIFKVFVVCACLGNCVCMCMCVLGESFAVVVGLASQASLSLA